MPLLSTSPSGASTTAYGLPGTASDSQASGVLVLVEEPELDLGVAGEQSQRRLEGGAERAARRGEDRDRQRCAPLEALDQPDAPAELRAFVVERERGLRGDREPQLADLAGQGEQRDGQRGHADERDAEADAEPGLGRERGVGQERQHRERGGQARRANRRAPADPRAAAEAAAGLTGPSARDRADQQEREEPEQDGGGLGRAGHAGGHGNAEHGLERDRPRPREGRRRDRAGRSSRAPAGRARRRQAWPPRSRAAPRRGRNPGDPRPSSGPEDIGSTGFALRLTGSRLPQSDRGGD